ncbi:hypothetical protein QBC32DRAFT_353554 [Pseudoneurospora amorphoporcata]|uniref:Uncharacterized protein n=1 Tax=Pseudoneurospora amorphoporcata TaxID=241081 RepID=A0AAN6NKV0_9PEZI|nr:hypothetical protein QBC32DRAFT_353554 [Pseudoneurospora amorphoporcata]
MSIKSTTRIFLLFFPWVGWVGGACEILKSPALVVLVHIKREANRRAAKAMENTISTVVTTATMTTDEVSGLIGICLGGYITKK